MTTRANVAIKGESHKENPTRVIRLRGPDEPPRSKTHVAIAGRHYDAFAAASVRTGIPLKRLVDMALDRVTSNGSIDVEVAIRLSAPESPALAGVRE